MLAKKTVFIEKYPCSPEEDRFKNTIGLSENFHNFIFQACSNVGDITPSSKTAHFPVYDFWH